MILKIAHNTRYQFTMPQVYALQQLRLRPINKPGMTILNWQLSVTGGDQQLSYKDQHKNQVDLVLVSAGSETLIIHCEGEVQTDNLFGIMGDYSLHGPKWLYEFGIGMHLLLMYIYYLHYTHTDRSTHATQQSSNKAKGNTSSN